MKIRPIQFRSWRLLVTAIIFISLSLNTIFAQGTRLLRQPTISESHAAFAYGGDIWISNLNGGLAVRLTSTPAVESNPHFSPDGKWLAFTSNRSGNSAVYIVPIDGGTPKRLTWHPSSAVARGWSPDGKRVIYASNRETAPTNYNYLWTVYSDGGPSTKLTHQWGNDGSYSPDGKQLILDRVRRWDTEWRGYRGGQNTPLIVLNLKDNSETKIPYKSSTEIQPLWMGKMIYFLSDRDGVSNVWSYNPRSKDLKQVTTFKGSDVKWLAGNGSSLAIERDGFLHTLDPATGKTKQLNITVKGDFPWAETKWEDVSKSVNAAALSPTGKRVVMSARGEIFSVPVEHGNTRNITQSSDAADRAPIWSPKGENIAWFSDAGGNGYALMLAAQDGLSEPKSLSIGVSKMAWEPTWSPDGKHIAFVDDDVRIRVINIESGEIKTIDTGGTNLERGYMGITWSKDSEWLTYSKTGTNNFRRIMVWSAKDQSVKAITNAFADSFSPSWDMDGKHLYFLASTELALGSGWANTSSMTSDPEYAAYVINLRKDEESPFKPRSDEEPVEEEKKEETKDDKDKDKGKDEEENDTDEKKEDKKSKDESKEKKDSIVIDFEGIERRIIALPISDGNYQFTLAAPAGSVFIGESKPGNRGVTIQKFSLKDREAKEFASGARSVSVSTDAKKMLARINGSWKVMDTGKTNAKSGKSLKVDLQMKLNRTEEWTQIFEETWRYERDYFYDPDMHGRDWQVVHDRYAPLIPYVKHRADLTYVLDQVNGELSVGHSFVSGGDYPDIDRSVVGLLGADLAADNGRWKITQIYTTESWNPNLTSPLDRPELNVKEGYYIVGVNGEELKDTDDPFMFLDGTVNRQTVLYINEKPEFEGAWKETIVPVRSEYGLRQRAWVENNRRMVDKLSGGKLAYVWVPNTGGPGFVSFNRYYFAQQDKQGAVIDERFNGGGLLDDYMVDLMTRSIRAALTNEVPNGTPIRLPSGILGPKVLLINEMAGSGGDFFPWVFRQQNAGPLIGTRTWGGLVKSSTHYRMIDGGRVTAPDNAVFDPVNNKWVAENEGVAPDIEVFQDAKSLSEGRDAQLERAVKEALLLLEKQKETTVTPPKYSSPAKQN
jgi:tricorn protease